MMDGVMWVAVVVGVAIILATPVTSAVMLSSIISRQEEKQLQRIPRRRKP